MILNRIDFDFYFIWKVPENEKSIAQHFHSIYISILLRGTEWTNVDKFTIWQRGNYEFIGRKKRVEWMEF